MQITGVLLRKDNTHSSRSYPISTANSTKTTAVSIFLQVIEPFRRNYTSTLRTNFAKQLSGTETKQYPTVPVPLTETSWRNRRTQLRSSARTPVHREYRQKRLFFRFFFPFVDMSELQCDLSWKWNEKNYTFICLKFRTRFRIQRYAKRMRLPDQSVSVSTPKLPLLGSRIEGVKEMLSCNSISWNMGVHLGMHLVLSA